MYIVIGPEIFTKRRITNIYKYLLFTLFRPVYNQEKRGGQGGGLDIVYTINVLPISVVSTVVNDMTLSTLADFTASQF